MLVWLLESDSCFYNRHTCSYHNCCSKRVCRLFYNTNIVCAYMHIWPLTVDNRSPARSTSLFQKTCTAWWHQIKYTCMGSTGGAIVLNTATVVICALQVSYAVLLQSLRDIECLQCIRTKTSTNSTKRCNINNVLDLMSVLVNNIMQGVGLCASRAISHNYS